MPSESLRVAYAYADGNSDRYTNGNGHGNTDGHGDGDAYGNSDGNANCNAGTKAYSNTEASSNAAAASVALSGNVKAGTREAIREFPLDVKGGTRSSRSFCRGSRVGCNNTSSIDAAVSAATV